MLNSVQSVSMPPDLLASVFSFIGQDNWDYFINLNDNDYPITSNQELG